MKNLFFFFLIAASFLASCQPEALPVIKGKVVFAGDTTKGVENTIVEAISEYGNYQTSVAPDGTYELSVQPGVYTVRPFKRTDTLNGIDLNDRVLIQKHLIGVISLNQWQKFAADVNDNGQMTTFDAYLVGAAVYNVSNARSIVGGWWTFCPQDYVASGTDGFYIPDYPTSVQVDAQGVVPDVDFVGFRRGDVNLNANPGQ